MKTSTLAALAFAAITTAAGAAQQTPDAGKGSFADAALGARQQLEESLAELARLREQMAQEKIPLSRKLSELESELGAIRLEYQQASRLLDTRALDLTNLRGENKLRQDEADYLSTLLGEYVRNLETRLHITELQRSRNALEAARLAPENSNLSEEQRLEAQVSVLSASLERLHEALGGTSFPGRAIDPRGQVLNGTFTRIGPAAVFRAEDGGLAGSAEQRLGSLDPVLIPFQDPAAADAAAQLVQTGRGLFPLDASGGDAHKLEETRDTLWEHVQKGGIVMVPIFALAGAALLVALLKWIALLRVRRPAPKQVQRLVDAVAAGDREVARQAAAAIPGPTGTMLSAGVEHVDEPQELAEEVMYETVLATRLRLQSYLPFIAITASAAPLLGLLGTVTGIMKTFALITVFGTGDVKTLSSGISEALITTEFGLYVAIPSLLLYAFLSRRARAIIDGMEKSAIAFVNQLAKSPFRRAADTPAVPREAPAPPRTRAATREEVKEILIDLLSPVVRDSLVDSGRQPAAVAVRGAHDGGMVRDGERAGSQR